VFKNLGNISKLQSNFSLETLQVCIYTVSQNCNSSACCCLLFLFSSKKKNWIKFVEIGSCKCRWNIWRIQ